MERVSITGLGPHREFSAEFNPVGRTLVSGPSESGKTFLLEAITFCLWGRSHGGKFRPDAITDGEQKAAVEILLDSGRLIRRSVTRSATQRRTITMGDDTQAYTSENAFAEALGDLGHDTDTLRVVIVPFEWVPMVEGNARPFRDLLTRILPEVNVGAEVEAQMIAQGFAVLPGEAELTEKEVMALRAAARKTRDEAAGRVQAGQERLSSLQTMKPQLGDGDGGAVDPALVEAARAWAEYDRLVGATSLRTAAAQALAAWEQRAASIGPEPAWDPAYDTADLGLRQAQSLAAQATQQYQQMYGQNQAAVAQMQQFAGGDPSVCPTCQRPGWAAGLQYVAQLQQYQAQLQAGFEQATAQWQAANQALAAATELAAASREAEMRRRSWQEAKRSLGNKPVVPDAPGAEVAPPTSPRPDTDQLAAAQMAARQVAAQEGALRQWQSNHDAAVAAIARDSERHEAATRDYDRLSALLEAVRLAPSTVAARQALTLGDLGPVTLEFGDNPAVKVLVDGRPWWLASRGRQVVADMWLRGAIRRVLDKEWLPIVVDNVQDVGGQPLPEVSGPVILLQTTDDKGLRVRRK